MRKLTCIRCWEIWYTANTHNSKHEICENCGGDLKDITNKVIKEDENELEPK